MDSSEPLLQAARSGDEAALDDLLARHLGRLVRFVQSSMSAGLAGTLTAEDIVQEAAIVAARRFPEFEALGFHPHALRSAWRGHSTPDFDSFSDTTIRVACDVPAR